MLRSLVVSSHPTSSIPTAGRTEIAALASYSTQASLAPGYLDAALERYPEAILVRAFGFAGPLRACMLVERHASAAGRLVYCGPSFSSRGAYVRAFEELVTALCDEPGPFAIAMEIETPAVLRMLRRLLPTCSLPRSDGQAPTPDAQAMASSLLAMVSHVRDFDGLTMTSRVGRSMRDGTTPERYVVGFVPCDGTEGAREALLAELREGIADVELALAGRASGARPMALAAREGARP